VSGRAVILGGGGVTGIAWQTGILRGLQDAGVELGKADAIIGTSAGSFAGAYLACGVVGEYFDLQFTAEAAEIAASMPPESIEGFRKAIVEGGGDPEATGRGLGRMAIAAKTVSTEDRARVVSSRLPATGWPAAPLRMTAIDAHTGELHLFDKNSGVSLTAAAEASGAVPGLWPVVEALGRTWIDGGSCSAANADLGAAYDSVVIIAPVVAGFPGQRGTLDEVADLKAAGVDVVLIHPDERASAAIGVNVFDPARRGPAAEAGRTQGQGVATQVLKVWSRLERAERSPAFMEHVSGGE
jgi:NTE family protein